jgi:hypothetical protein
MSQPGGLIYKDRDNAPVCHQTRGANGDGAHTPPTPGAAAPEMSWQQWVDDRLDHRLEMFTEACGEALGTKAREVREHGDYGLGVVKRELTALLHEQIIECTRLLRQEAREETKAAREQLERDDASTRRELELCKRELALLQKEIGLERELRALHEDVAAAKAEIPKLPAIAAQLEAGQKRLREELATVKDKHARLRTDWSTTDYALGELRKEVTAARAASIEVEFESSSTHFQMKATHPAAAAALKQFAAEIVSGSADGTIWLPGSAGNA